MSTTGERFVVAIDFGTTYSGVAACYSGTPDDIEVIKTWPGSNGITSEKVPSEFMYDGGPSTASQSPIDLIHGIIAPKKTSTPAIKDVKWGFQLKPGEDHFVHSAEVAEKLHVHERDVISAVADYLHKIHEHSLNILRLRFGQTFVATTPIHFVLTVPAIWSDTAKHATLEAAHRAGFGGKLIDMISEPEAAATYTLKAIRPNHLKTGDNIVVCDAGGGTVDLISYHIVQLEPLAIKESTIGTGGLCGSVFLNIGFENLVRNRVGNAKFDKFKNQKPRAWQSALKNFEDYVKRSFCAGDITEENIFNIPFPGLPDDEAVDLVDGFLIITAADVQNIFDPVIEKIAKLVEEQVSSIQDKGNEVAAIVLVGGFGQSSYLHSHLNGRFNNDRPPPYPGTAKRRRVSAGASRGRAIEIMQPIYAWTAVARGALLRGLGASTVASRQCRYHYGVIYNNFFNPQIHPLVSRFWSEYRELYLANHCVRWFVSKDQAVNHGNAISFNFVRCFNTDQVNNAFDHSSNDQLEVEDVLVACSDATAPPMYDATLIKVCTLKTKLRTVPRHHFTLQVNSKGHQYFKIDHEIVMKIDSASIHFELMVDGHTYGSVTASYYH